MAIYKCGQGFELGTTENKSSKWPEWDSNPASRFSKAPIINGSVKLLLFTFKIEFNSFASNMIKLSVIETKWTSLLARIRALIPSGPPNENIVQNHLNIALLNVF